MPNGRHLGKVTVGGLALATHARPSPLSNASASHLFLSFIFASTVVVRVKIYFPELPRKLPDLWSSRIMRFNNKVRSQGVDHDED